MGGKQWRRGIAPHGTLGPASRGVKGNLSVITSEGNIYFSETLATADQSIGLSIFTAAMSTPVPTSRA
jgi:hypothetical protein